MSRLSSKVTRALVPLSNLPERSKWVDETVATITSNATGWVFKYAKMRAERDSDGNWRLRGSVSSSRTSTTANANITIAGVVFGANPDLSPIFGSDQPVSYYFGTDGYAQAGTGNMPCGTLTGATAGFNVTFDVAIKDKPTWFDANKEAGFSIAAQVEDATATTSGLAPARSSLGAYMSTGGTAQGSVIPFDTVYESTGTGFTSNGSGLFTCNFTGHILINIQLHTQNLVGGDLALRKNGVNYLSGTNMAANGDVNNNYGFNMAVASGDTIDFVYVGLGGTYQYPVASQAVGGASTISLVRIA